MAAEPSPAAERERAASGRRAVPFLGLVAGTCMADAASYLQAFSATMAVMAGVLAVAGVAAWLVLRPARRAAITG